LLYFARLKPGLAAVQCAAAEDSFRRSFKLPSHVTGEAISASYDKGVLTVRVAGAHKGAEAQRISIESK